MKKLMGNCYRTPLGLAASVSLAIAVPGLGAAIAGAATVSSPDSLNSAETSVSDGTFQIAQASDSCRQVAVTGGLYVRSEPSVYSVPLGVVEPGRSVTVEAPAPGEWVEVSAPIQGYMSSLFLAPCDANIALAAVPPVAATDACREVASTGGLYVREEPSVDSDILGAISYGDDVTITNETEDGWVGISAPYTGFVAADYLSYCN